MIRVYCCCFYAILAEVVLCYRAGIETSVTGDIFMETVIEYFPSFSSSVQYTVAIVCGF